MARTEQARIKAPAINLDLLFIGLCLVGIGISGYLTWTHFTDTPIICTADQSCDTVNRSAYAYFPPNWGVPVALLGLLGYLLMAGLGFARWRLTPSPAARARGRLDLALFITTLGGLIFSAYLTAMELWVIHAICWWCVASALTISALFGLALLRIWNSE